MKTISETIEWYTSTEDRRWKRIYHCIELTIMAVAGLVISGAISLYGDGTKLQLALLLFIAGISFASALIAFALYRSFFIRWHIFVITLGLGCSIGVSALAGLLLLELQLANS